VGRHQGRRALGKVLAETVWNPHPNLSPHATHNQAMVPHGEGGLAVAGMTFRKGLGPTIVKGRIHLAKSTN
jgi:hypothetical protein